MGARPRLRLAHRLVVLHRAAAGGDERERRY
jgi:hypothetical protein